MLTTYVKRFNSVADLWEHAYPFLGQILHEDYRCLDSIVESVADSYDGSAAMDTLARILGFKLSSDYSEEYWDEDGDVQKQLAFDEPLPCLLEEEVRFPLLGVFSVDDDENLVATYIMINAFDVTKDPEDSVTIKDNDS